MVSNNASDEYTLGIMLKEEPDEEWESAVVEQARPTKARQNEGNNSGSQPCTTYQLRHNPRQTNRSL
jgi:hypothetical protein